MLADTEDGSGGGDCPAPSNRQHVDALLADDLAALDSAGWDLQQLEDLRECEDLGIPVSWPARLNGVVAARIIASGLRSSAANS